MPLKSCGGQSSENGGLLEDFTMWFLGLELRLPGRLVASLPGKQSWLLFVPFQPLAFLVHNLLLLVLLAVVV